MTNEISLDKKYRTRNGREVVLYCIDAPGRFPVHGRVEDEFGNSAIKSWLSDGKYCANSPTGGYDLIEVGSYDDFKIDDPVLVRDHIEGSWQKGHFAGVSQLGYLMTWDGGGTSWTTKSHSSWLYCKRALERS